MFSSGFSESAIDLEADADMGPGDDASVSDLGSLSQQFDDSDYEDDEDNMDNDADFSSDEPDRHEMLGTGPTDGGPSQLDTPTTSNKRISVTNDEVTEQPVLFGVDVLDQSDEQGPSARNTRPKLSHPSSPRSRELALEHNEARPRSPSVQTQSIIIQASVEVPGPRKTRVVVRDVAYTTYRAVLYYVSVHVVHSQERADFGYMRRSTRI